MLPYHNMQLKYWNEGATEPLILPVLNILNTDDDQLYANIKTNSAVSREWVTTLPEHDVPAILCGSGPSLRDHIEDIRSWQQTGAKVFAMNGAARFLGANGILPDYQVMIDARPETADLIGPAKQHLFASQVSPECFRRVPTAILWHLQIEDIEDYFPDDTPEYAQIGGAASVGNTATCLVYVMGYRNLHCYGYDSSHRDDKSHVFHQSLNDGEPCAIVNYRGNQYKASLTMKLQAEQFQKTSKALKELGCSIEVHGTGLLPDIYNAPASNMSEADKYKAMWDIPQYRIVSPGEHSAADFLKRFAPTWDEHVIDFGCGTGRGGLAISKETGTQVTLVDFADNCRDEDAKSLPFVKADLSQQIPVSGGYGYCCDVMEHIPPEQVDDVIRNIMDCVPQCFFRIDFNEDMCGAFIGETLHLSVHPHEWWVETFERLGFNVSWSLPQGGYGLFEVGV